MRHFYNLSTAFLSIFCLFLFTTNIQSMFQSAAKSNNWQAQKAPTIIQNYEPKKQNINILSQSRPVTTNVITDSIYYQYGFACDQNGREEQEDTACIHNVGEGQLFAIFDGHSGVAYGGQSGTKIANYLCNNFHIVFETHLIDKINPEAIISTKNIFEKTFKELDEAIKTEQLHAGATSVIAYFEKNYLHCAWIGDCAFVVEHDNKIIAHSINHDPENEQEQKRVKDARGILFREIQGAKQGPLRINTLPFTRTFGHHWAKGQDTTLPILAVHYPHTCANDLRLVTETGDPLPEQWHINPLPGQIIAVPDYKRIPLSAKNRWVILASSGFWRALSPEQALEIVINNDKSDLPTLAQFLLEQAKKKSTANITVFIIDLLTKQIKRST